MSFKNVPIGNLTPEMGMDAEKVCLFVNREMKPSAVCPKENIATRFSYSYPV